jgi:multidrug efflux pump subunit AcrA (membrane-fusion protein)
MYLLLGATLVAGCENLEKTSPQRLNIVDVVFASGSIINENQYAVTSQSEGYLVNSYVNEGSIVTVGQKMFHVYDENQKVQLESAVASYSYALANVNSNSAVITQLNAQLTQAKNKMETDSLSFVRYQNLIKSNAVSQQDYDRAKLNFENSKQELIAVQNIILDTKSNLELELTRAKANLVSQQTTNSYYVLTSKADGTVLQVYKKNGEFVKRGETLANIGSGKFIARLLVSEDDINRVKVGQLVLVELNTDKNNSHKAEVLKIYPAFDTQEQSFIVEAQFVDQIDNLKSGTQLQANIVIQSKSDALVIPSKYLLDSSFVLNSKNEIMKVHVGIKTAEWTEVLWGLTDKTQIIMPE